jgi:hypothetical protein
MTNIIIPGDGSPMANINFMRDNADEVVEDYSYQRVSWLTSSLRYPGFTTLIF